MFLVHCLHNPYTKEIVSSVYIASLSWVYKKAGTSEQVYLLHVFVLDSDGGKIKVEGSVVELDGDEMTRIIWEKIKEKVLNIEAVFAF